MEQREIPEPDQPVLPRPGREETVAAPKCTAEGAGYTVECWPCRLRGERALYVGETSRSPYQRAREHENEIQKAKKSHPMVMHFLEKHEGTEQEILVRTVKETRTALERQAWEAVAIDRAARKPEQCLNLKNEWSWSQRPALTSGVK